MRQATKTFTCFGGDCTVSVEGSGPLGPPEDAVVVIRDEMLDWHAVFSRFKPESELTALNSSADADVSVTPLMARFVEAALGVAQMTGGLVDPTLLDEIEAAGYKADHLRATVALPLALALAGERSPATSSPSPRWKEVSVDPSGPTVSRPPGVRFDGGGVVKGLFADHAADRLSEYAAFVVDCEGDMRVGGSAGAIQLVAVGNPFNGRLLHEFSLSGGAVATATIAKRSWYAAGMRPAHHLLNPCTGRPAYSGVVQVSALAPTAVEGEALCKAALLSGPDSAPRWLEHGGVILLDDSSTLVV
ncbi:MAG: FAD:protein FMN transferase [Actinomycetota bacterium]